VIEQLDDNRLIRPRAEYIGPPYPNTSTNADTPLLQHNFALESGESFY
jgi:hypothetical protein